MSARPSEVLAASNSDTGAATVPVAKPSRLSGKGLAAALGAFVIWGLLPVYLKPLHDIGSVQVIAHRVAWSCVFVLGFMLARGELGKLWVTLSRPALVARLAFSASLITINWLTYVWAVAHGHVVETSLGYFINPLLNVLLGVIVLRERLSRVQWLAVAVAGLGVAYLTVMTGQLPWIALTLAMSFGLYGFVRKVISVEALPGLATETLLLLPFALVYLVGVQANGTAVFGHGSAGINAMLIGAGPVTAIPLFLFAYGARLIPYSTIGLIQYVGPTLQLLCGLFLYHEPFERTRAVGFVLIWSALGIYAAEGLWRARKNARTS